MVQARILAGAAPEGFCAVADVGDGRLGNHELLRGGRLGHELGVPGVELVLQGVGAVPPLGLAVEPQLRVRGVPRRPVAELVVQRGHHVRQRSGLRNRQRPRLARSGRPGRHHGRDLAGDLPLRLPQLLQLAGRRLWAVGLLHRPPSHLPVREPRGFRGYHREIGHVVLDALLPPAVRELRERHGIHVRPAVLVVLVVVHRVAHAARYVVPFAEDSVLL
mmetsp:Transcript_45081/g.136682  ORF Transcript_45081/g.136682 Transcript_45081/m.136682 type:complete len:219 (+) Transcript_45081:558-1214(+)